MKTVEVALLDLSRKLETHWHSWICESSAASSFPLTLPLGRADTSELKTDFAQVNRDALDWLEFAKQHDVDVRWTNRRIHGSTQQLATHLVVPDLDTAAALASGTWTNRIQQARIRRAELLSQFDDRVTSSLIRAVSGYSDVDFGMLMAAAAWLETHDPTGLTARQVPVEGVHGKWLNTHRRELLALSGREEMNLVGRGTQVRYTYLDPAHRRAGLRWHDSHILGDSSLALYEPTLALISENKDTAQLFGELDGAISIHGAGYAAVSQLPAIPWVSTIPTLVYWGDIDAEGYEILDGLRAAGLTVTSILMDQDAYEKYERYGTSSDKNGKQLTARAAKPLEYLTDAERAVYEQLVDPAWTRVRRMEQERIPLEHALSAVLLLQK